MTMGLPQQWTEQGRKLGLIVDTASSNDLLNKRAAWQRRASNDKAAAAATAASGALVDKANALIMLLSCDSADALLTVVSTIHTA
jgi:hypothetical protein